MYFGWQDGSSNSVGSTPKVAVSRDKGLTWSNITTLGSGTIKNVQFPTMIAGDDSRAAFAFLGSTTGGDDQAGASRKSAGFNGVWHLYVATTYDSGVTWSLVDATPTDPVQRGCIWMAGGSNSCRNLLDFMDATVDRRGHVLVGYADGCVSLTCVGSTGKPADSRAALATISRQTAGTGLFAAFGG